MGIYSWRKAADPVFRTMRWHPTKGIFVAVVEHPKEVLMGDSVIWPVYRYQEEFHWYEWSTPGYADTDNRREWPIQVPDWASHVDVMRRHTGGRGFDGTRGFGNNDGAGGHVFSHFGSMRSSHVIPIGVDLIAGVGRPGVESPFGNRLPFPSVVIGLVDTINSSSASGSGSTGAMAIDYHAFGRSWPGGAGGARDLPGQPYGGAGGGGIGAPPVGGDRKNGQNGAPGYVALRLRSGPVPDGHAWPQNPDWANPQ